MSEPTKQMLGTAVIVILGVIAIGILVPAAHSTYSQVHTNTAEIAANSARDEARFNALHETLSVLTTVISGGNF